MVCSVGLLVPAVVVTVVVVASRRLKVNYIVGDFVRLQLTIWLVTSYDLCNHLYGIVPFDRVQSDVLSLDWSSEVVSYLRVFIVVCREHNFSSVLVDNWIPFLTIVRIFNLYCFNPTIVTTFGVETSEVAWFQEVELFVREKRLILVRSELN